MPLLHHGRLQVTINRVQQRVVRVHQRTRRITLGPKVVDHQAGVWRWTRLESDRAVIRVGGISVGQNRTAAWRIEGLGDEERGIESGARE